MQSVPQSHNHVFLGERHEANERKTWAVIILCGVMMLVEIVGGALFNSLALIADGLHMSTHAGAMLIAALAYTYARRHATDHRFVFGTGKLGDLAGFTSAIVLAVIALFIGYEAIERFISALYPSRLMKRFRLRWWGCWSTLSARGCSVAITMDTVMAGGHSHAQWHSRRRHQLAGMDGPGQWRHASEAQYTVAAPAEGRARSPMLTAATPRARPR